MCNLLKRLWFQWWAQPHLPSWGTLEWRLLKKLVVTTVEHSQRNFGPHWICWGPTCPPVAHGIEVFGGCHCEVFSKDCGFKWWARAPSALL